MQDGIWRPGPPADDRAIQALRAGAGVEFPSEYLAQLAESNGGEGDLGAFPGWVVFWPAERVIEYNRMYEIPSALPGFYGFGSNGGGELLAFDVRERQPYAIVAIPWIPMELELSRTVASSFEAFRRLIGKAGTDAT